MLSRKRAQLIAVAAIFGCGIMLDQWSKIWVKTHMHLHECRRITDWFYISFIENNGMAFGIELFDKLLLTGFRIIATIAVACYIVKLIRRGVHWGYLVCLAAIMTGAAGNIVDCMLYGMIFTDPPYPQVAELVPLGQGYSTWFYGRVVDMLSFPIAEWDWPQWMPLVGGSHYVFFSYIFNVADAFISCGVIALMLFFPKTLSRSLR